MTGDPARDVRPPARERHRPPPLTSKQRWTRRLLTALFIAVLAGGLAISTVRQSTPQGGSSSMSGMNMGGSNADMIGITLRDIDGRRLALPGGTPGAVLFMARRGCPDCPRLARALVRASGDVTPPPRLALIGTDATETGDDLRAFDRAAGGLDVRYALDDRGGSVATQFGARLSGTVVVYDRDGTVRRREAPGPRQMVAVDRALHRSSRGAS